MKYRMTFDDKYKSIGVPVWVVERRDGFLAGWSHVTRTNDPSQFDNLARNDAAKRAIEPQYLKAPDGKGE